MKTKPPTDLFFIAGPCVIESSMFLDECCAFLSEEFKKVNYKFILKSSYYKANRTSYSSFRGPGIDKGLEMLKDVKGKYSLTITSDIHESWQAALAGHVVDIIQIPARLCQQTDVIEAAAAVGKPLNFKKGQFLSPRDMKYVVEKARNISLKFQPGSDHYYVTERGTFYGENKLVVDMRSFQIMKSATRCPVIYDASHSIQLPGVDGETSGGEIAYLTDLACAAVATGHVSGIFFETHPDPKAALCDGPIQLPFSQVASFLRRIISVYECVHK